VDGSLKRPIRPVRLESPLCVLSVSWYSYYLICGSPLVSFP
jgi:hypothetical protein